MTVPRSINVVLPKDIMEQVRARAFSESAHKQQRVTMSDVVRRYIQRGLGMDRGLEAAAAKRAAKKAAANG